MLKKALVGFCSGLMLLAVSLAATAKDVDVVDPVFSNFEARQMVAHVAGQPASAKAERMVYVAQVTPQSERLRAPLAGEKASYAMTSTDQRGYAASHILAAAAPFDPGKVDENQYI